MRLGESILDVSCVSVAEPDPGCESPRSDPGVCIAGQWGVRRHLGLGLKFSALEDQEAAASIAWRRAEAEAPRWGTCTSAHPGERFGAVEEQGQVGVVVHLLCARAWARRFA